MITTYNYTVDYKGALKISSYYQKFTLSGVFLHCGHSKKVKVLFILTMKFVLNGVYCTW